MPRIPQLLPCQGYANSKPLHKSQHFLSAFAKFGLR